VFSECGLSDTRADAMSVEFHAHGPVRQKASTEHIQYYKMA